MSFWIRELLIFALICTVTGDLFYEHMVNYIDYDVQPCENFYRHVCPRSITANETVSGKIEDLMTNLGNNGTIISHYDVIWFDYSTYKSVPSHFNKAEYIEELLETCDDDYACVYDTFLPIYTASELSVSRLELYFNVTAYNKNATQLALVTGNLLEVIDSDNETDYMLLYRKLRQRIVIIDQLEAHYNSQELKKDLSEMIAHLKSVILNILKRTSWLNELEDFGVEKWRMLEYYLQSMNIYFGMDEQERNKTIWYKANRKYNIEYFNLVAEMPLKTSLDLKIIHKIIDNKLRKELGEVNEQRLDTNEDYNALNMFDSVYVALAIVLANRNITVASKYASLGYTLSHEMYHTFIETGNEFVDEIFTNQTDCVQALFHDYCDIFREQSYCESGELTITEDGPDLEGIKAAYEAFVEAIGGPKYLAHRAYDDLPYSNEELFYYSLAADICGDVEQSQHEEGNEHSANYVRVNAMLSQLPGFSRTFGCLPSDNMYIPSDDRCNIFGESKTFF